MNRFGKILIFIALGIILKSCISVKEYQKEYLNDKDMQFEKRPIDSFEEDYHSYREAASGGAKSNSGGGCGCN
jgi:hypothetical protein